MSNWREPITDRTLVDVKGIDAGSLEYQKGTLNADDLNRIEDNYKYLMAKLRRDAIFIPHKLRNYTETVLEYVEKENSVLPDGYTQVEYIQSSATQYIDTGFKPNQDTRIVMDAQMISSASPQFYFGCRTASNAVNYNLLVTDSSHRTDYGESKVTISGVMVTDRVLIDKNKNICAVGNITGTNDNSTFQSAYNLFLFASNDGGSAKYNGSLRLYSCQIYDNSTLMRNFIPCINVSGTAGLYDMVNNQFYGNAGTGTFTAGAEVKTDPTYELVETKTTYTDWQENNLPWLSEINRIRANYNALVRLFLVGLGLPVLAESNYLDYQEVNNWERIALTGKQMYENMEQEYRYCGMEESGGDRLL